MAISRIRIVRVVAPGALGKQIEPKMRNLGRSIGRRMQRVVPKRTWALHDTIATDTDRTGDKVTTQVGYGDETVDYGTLVERGTSKSRAQPFARPAMLQSKSNDLNFKGDLNPKHGRTVVDRSS